MFYWLLLALAIGFEVTGTLSMKWSTESGHPAGLYFMLVMIACSYISLSIAIKKIALGVAYAMWEGVGIVLITFFSVLLFNETLSVTKLAGLGLLIAGITLIKLGTCTRRQKVSEGVS